MSGSTSKKKAAPLCVLCQQAIEPSTAPGLWLHVTASTCGNVITDGFGVSLDETYELIDGEIFERDLVIADPPKAPDQPPEKVEVALDGGTFKLHLPVVSDVVLPKNFADFNLSVALTTYTNHEEAINMMFDDFKVPKLGGASGDLGWSSFYSFQRCPYLWKRNYLDGERFDNTNLPMPLIVGSLLHLFLALRYQIQIDLVYPINPDSAFEELKQRNVHLEALREAWRLFETYRLFYESETKFLTPLAVEYHTVDPRTKESCRYDLIATVNGDKAPLIIDASQTDNYKEPVMVDLPTGAVIVEHKTTSRRDDSSLTGWINDGEVIGQVMLWNRLKLYRKFGPLQGVIINLLGKQQVPSMDRVFVPVNRTQSRQHTKDLKFWQAFRQLCLAQDHFPRARANCINRWGKCTQWKHCTGED